MSVDRLLWDVKMNVAVVRLGLTSLASSLRVDWHAVCSTCLDA